MPRRYYTRYRSRRTYVARRKWSPTLIQTQQQTAAIPDTNGYSTVTLCANASNQGTNVPVSTIIKVKNFKVVLDIVSLSSNASSSTIRNNFYAIMFVPQGFTVTANIPQEHPEWIMVWRTVDVGRPATDGAPTSPNIQMSSRLTRNLNSGDSIVLFHSYYNSSSASANISTTAIVSFVTCNN